MKRFRSLYAEDQLNTFEERMYGLLSEVNGVKGHVRHLPFLHPLFLVPRVSYLLILIICCYLLLFIIYSCYYYYCLLLL